MVLLKVFLRTIAFALSLLLISALSSFAQTSMPLSAADAVQIALDRAIAETSPVPEFDGTAEDQTGGNPPSQAKPPAANPGAPSLEDLGFPAAQTQANPKEQARLDKRSHMLKIHQRLGLITTGPLLATLIASSSASGRSSSSTGRDVHAALGGTTAGLYLTTAYFAVFAPKIPATKTRGPIRLHKALAFIHGPGMILTPVLGAMAFDQKNRGQKVHGIASAHGAVAVVTAGAYGLAILSVSVRF